MYLFKRRNIRFVDIKTKMSPKMNNYFGKTYFFILFLTKRKSLSVWSRFCIKRIIIIRLVHNRKQIRDHKKRRISIENQWYKKVAKKKKKIWNKIKEIQRTTHIQSIEWFYHLFYACVCLSSSLALSLSPKYTWEIFLTSSPLLFSASSLMTAGSVSEMIGLWK